MIDVIHPVLCDTSSHIFCDTYPLVTTILCPQEIPWLTTLDRQLLDCMCSLAQVSHTPFLTYTPMLPLSPLSSHLFLSPPPLIYPDIPFNLIILRFVPLLPSSHPRSPPSLFYGLPIQASVAGHPWQPALEDKTTSEWLEDPLLGGADVHPLITDDPTRQAQGLGLGLGLGQGLGVGKEIDDLLVGLTERAEGSLSQALVKAMKASRKVPDDQVGATRLPLH